MASLCVFWMFGCCSTHFSLCAMTSQHAEVELWDSKTELESIMRLSSPMCMWSDVAFEPDVVLGVCVPLRHISGNL